MQATQSSTAGTTRRSRQFRTSRVIPRESESGLRAELSVGGAGIAEGAGLVHDAANLLGALSLYADLLAVPGVLHDEYREYAAELKLLSNRSWSMINRLMNHALMEREAKRGIERTSLPRVVERCLGMLSKVGGGRKIEFVCVAGASHPVVVAEEAVERILTNLVKNSATAIGSEGVIRITVGCGEDDDEGAPRSIVMTVSDNGCGMDSMTVRSLQESNGVATGGGRGLGLRVVRELVALSGGCLSIRSQPGVGTSVSAVWHVAAAAGTEGLSFAEAPVVMEHLIETDF